LHDSIGRPDHLIAADDIDTINVLKVIAIQTIQVPMINKFGRTRVIDQHIEPAPFRDGSIYQLLTIRISRHIASANKHLNSVLLTFSGHLLGSICTRVVVDHNMTPL